MTRPTYEAATLLLALVLLLAIAGQELYQMLVRMGS